MIEDKKAFGVGMTLGVILGAGVVSLAGVTFLENELYSNCNSIIPLSIPKDGTIQAAFHGAAPEIVKVKAENLAGYKPTRNYKCNTNSTPTNCLFR